MKKMGSEKILPHQRKVKHEHQRHKHQKARLHLCGCAYSVVQCSQLGPNASSQQLSHEEVKRCSPSTMPSRVHSPWSSLLYAEKEICIVVIVLLLLLNPEIEKKKA
jgi:hypothetical protein